MTDDAWWAVAGWVSALVCLGFLGYTVRQMRRVLAATQAAAMDAQRHARRADRAAVAAAGFARRAEAAMLAAGEGTPKRRNGNVSGACPACRSTDHEGASDAPLGSASMTDSR